MIRRILAVACVLYALPALAADNPFVMVTIGQPADRAVYASAILRATQLGARGVVIKFFLRDAKTPAGDSALATAMAKSKVLLQASRDPAFGAPLEIFRARAYDVGNVDVASFDRVPIPGSLFTKCVEVALNTKASIVAGKSVTFGDQTLALDVKSQATIPYARPAAVPHISLADFLDPKSRPDVRGRIVILGADIEQHRIFYQMLISLYDSVTHQAHNMRSP